MCRALPVEPRHMMIRELILQLKTGRIVIDYFHRKFGVDVLQEFVPSFDRFSREGYLSLHNGSAEVPRTGLLQIDRLLPEFFDPQLRGTRYTRRKFKPSL